MGKVERIEKDKQFILKLYDEGLRPSKIAAMLNHDVSLETIQKIALEHKKEKYLEKSVNGVSYREIIRLYSVEEKEVLDIMYIYPELNFGQVKNTIEQFYHLQSIQAPRKTKFPKELIEEYLETHGIEDACEEFGYMKATLLRKLEEATNMENMNKEELFAYKMKLLSQDVERVQNGFYPLKNFKRKYKGLTPDVAISLIKQYNDSKNKK